MTDKKTNKGDEASGAAAKAKTPSLVVSPSAPVLTGAELLTGQGLRPVEIPTPKGGSPVSVVYLKEPTAGEGAAFADAAKGAGEDGLEKMFPLVARCIVGADGKRLLSAEQIEQAAEMPASSFLPILHEFSAMLGISVAGGETSGEGSGETETSDSSTASPSE